MLKSCEFFIEPRQSGKTHSLIDMLTNASAPTIMIVRDGRQLNLIKEKYRLNNYDNIVTVQYFASKHPQLDFKQNVLIDEYLFFQSNYIRLLDKLLPVMTKHIYVKTTSVKLYNQDIFDFIKAYRKLSSIIQPRLVFNAETEFDELCYNLLTHPKTNLYFGLERQRHISQEKYKTEILGKLFKEEDDE